jgi:hypothetical protein
MGRILGVAWARTCVRVCVCGGGGVLAMPPAVLRHANINGNENLSLEEFVKPLQLGTSH